MAGFIRVRNCCCCGGSLKGATITIGTIYLVLNLLGYVLGTNVIFTAAVITINNYSKLLGVCELGFFMPLLATTSAISALVNLSLLYGSITNKSSFLGVWLAWNIPYPFIQLAHAIWGYITIGACEDVAVGSQISTAVITVSVFNTISLVGLLYFAVLVYSLYKDLQEEEKKNNSYGGRILLPTKNWDEAMTPYTSYDPSVATPASWGYLPPTQSTKGPAPPPPPMQKQKGGIPRPQSTSTYSS